MTLFQVPLGDRRLQPRSSRMIRDSQSSSPIELLTRLNEEYVRAVGDADVAWFDRHLTTDFLNSNPDGTLVDRAAFLAQIGRGAGVVGIAPHDVIIRLFDDIAIIHARTAYRTPAGAEGRGRYTDTWARQRDGSWLCIAAHVTRG
jgi:ketosteroid isomerase-like protein